MKVWDKGKGLQDVSSLFLVLRLSLILLLGGLANGGILLSAHYHIQI
jgi:hypothetical protein